MEVLTLYPDISNLEREYNAAVAREQSLANRMLGAATWAAQRADTQSQLKTGGIVGGVGVVGGAVGNIIENTTYNGQPNTDVKQSR